MTELHTELLMKDEPVFFDIGKGLESQKDDGTVTPALEQLKGQTSSVPEETQGISNYIIGVQTSKAETKYIICIPCQECNRKFDSEDKLLRHIRVAHRGENPYQCAMCEYSTYNSVLFEEHVNIHKGIKPYKCSYCSYKSVSKKNTKQHESKHRPCNKCDFIASNRRNLELHMDDKHGVSKDVKCSSCNFACSDRKFLRAHFDRAHKVKCQICFTLLRKHSLKHHMETFHTEKTNMKPQKNGKQYKCEVCGWSSRTMLRILLHLIHHPVQKVDESFIDVSILRKYGIMS